MTSGPSVQSPVHSLLSWSYWFKNNKDISVPDDVVQSQHQDNGSSTIKSSLSESSFKSVAPVDLPHSATSRKISGWDRLRSLYEQPSMERDYSQRIIRMAFLSGFFLGGFSTLAQARETFERCNVGRGYLSHSDAFKRRADYAIVRFAKSGFVMGFKCALISGSIVCVSIFTTHLAVYREQFSSWYFPAVSALVGGIFTFPLGIIGSLKAVALGLTSGFTLAAGLHVLALSVNKSVDEAYWAFKEDYENKLRIDQEWEARVTALMKSEGIRWRGSAATKLRELDDQKLSVQDA